VNLLLVESSEVDEHGTVTISDGRARHLLDVLKVAPGQAVRAGERLAVIEAMKMENILVAANAGVVARVVAAKGASLAVDDVILEFEAAGAAK